MIDGAMDPVDRTFMHPDIADEFNIPVVDPAEPVEVDGADLPPAKVVLPLARGGLRGNGGVQIG